MKKSWKLTSLFCSSEEGEGFFLDAFQGVFAFGTMGGRRFRAWEIGFVRDPASAPVSTVVKEEPATRHPIYGACSVSPPDMAETGHCGPLDVVF